MPVQEWFIQAYFTRLTATTALTAYFIDEFGIMPAMLTAVLAFAFWKMRGRLPTSVADQPLVAIAPPFR